MPLLINGQALADAVAADGLARVAHADDGSVHVLYLEREAVRSMLAADWPPPLPPDWTAAEIAAALAARQAAVAQARQDAAALRARVLALAGSAVGVRIDDLLAGQVKALVAILLWQAGAIDNAGVVQPLAQWVDR